jgi:hypothetical protein
MKTLMTAAVFAVFTFTGVAKADLPNLTGKPTTKVKKVTTSEVRDALEDAGYSPKANKNKDGKIISYSVEVKRGDTTITVYMYAAEGNRNIWFEVDMITLDERNPPTKELLLAFLGTHDQLWPAYLVYYPKTKGVQMAMSMSADDFNTATLKGNLDKMMDKFLIVADVFKKVKAAEEKAQSNKD